MGEVLTFPQQRCKPQLARSLALGAQILLFTGVRYCRDLAPIKRRRGTRRKEAASSSALGAERDQDQV
jgi:hypothetical protein